MNVHEPFKTKLRALLMLSEIETKASELKIHCTYGQMNEAKKCLDDIMDITNEIKQLLLSDLFN